MIAEFQGYQKMSPEHHPEVLKAAKASALNNAVDNFLNTLVYF